MSRKCVICGRPIKTGIKYCYVCRSIQKAGGKKKDNSTAWIIATSGVLFFIISFFSKDKFMDVFGWIGLIIGFPLFLGLILKHLDEKRKLKINNVMS